MTDIYTGSTILVLGGTGSIGSAIVEELLRHAPKAVRIFSRSEEKQFWMKRQHKGRQTRFLLGDIRDINRLRRAMRNVDYVFHCAALKHVAMCEDNPSEALSINAVGTQNVLDVAAERGVKRVLHVSTDKVCEPVSVMGETKALAEKIATRFNRHDDTPVVVTMRLGNVMYSSGSLGQIIRERVRKGLPYHITDPDMRRFFITRAEVAKFGLRALADGNVGEVWIPDMEEHNIVDMARKMARKAARDFKVDYDPDNYTVIGAGRYENAREALWTDAEHLRIKLRKGESVIPRE